MLYFVATPIGNLKDITLRALEVLKAVDVIACEDTRVSSKLLNHYGISKPLLSYHDHNAATMRPRLLAFLKEGKQVAYITDGGMPLISDPGFKLLLACQQDNLAHTVIPGASSPLMALCLSGLSPERFFFCGFLASKQAARKTALEELKQIQATLLFFESPKRLLPFLRDARDVLGDRTGAVCREMTKLYEEAQRGSLSSLIAHYDTLPPRGEIVVVVEGAPCAPSLDQKDIETHLERALQTQSVKEAVELISKAFSLSKREVYQHALALKSEKTRLP
jgi:16S rRNA (cytidine1402-2'-O)-methyltransferase